MNATLPSPLEIVRRVLAAPGAPCVAGDAIDVGAHTGSFAGELLRSGLFARVIAFEPNPVNADALAAIASLDSRLDVVRAAVGESAGDGELHCDANTATGSLLVYRDDYSTDGPIRQLAVTVVSLDGFRAGTRADAAPVRLLKVDTQGHDLAVIRGAGRLLASDRPVVIVEMIYVPMYAGQAEPEDILAAMRASGYQLYTLFNIHATIEGRLAYADALFVPREYEVPKTQQYIQMDNHASYLSQIATLERICRERLEVINVLDAELKRLSPAKRTDA